MLRHFNWISNSTPPFFFLLYHRKSTLNPWFVLLNGNISFLVTQSTLVLVSLYTRGQQTMPWPMSQIWPPVCFLVAWKLRMFLFCFVAFLSGYRNTYIIPLILPFGPQSLKYLQTPVVHPTKTQQRKTQQRKNR